MNNIINFMGIRLMNYTMSEAIDSIVDKANRRSSTAVAFINADCVNKFNNLKYYKSLKYMDYIFADGIGIKIASMIFGNSVRDNVNGTDMFPFLLERCEQCDLSVYFYGADEKTVNKLVMNLSEQYKELDIVGHHSGYTEKNDEAKLIKTIQEKKPQIIFVAKGAPLQEEWMSQNRDHFPDSVMIGVGGLFDFYSGRIKRAPKILRLVKLEWLYRLYCEPTRLWRRYILGNPIFLLRVICHKLFGGKNEV